MISYTITLRNPAGDVLHRNLPNSAFTWTIRERYVGSLKMLIPGGIIDPAWITEDTRFELWRRVDSGTPEQIGGQWLAENITTSGNNKDITVECVDFNGLLARRIIDYAASTADVTNAYTDKSGAADDVIKAFVRENIGALATDTTRRLANLTVAADVSLGASIYKEASRKNLLATLQDISDDSYNKGTYLTWGWLFSENDYTFDTRINQWGNDHGSTSGNTILISTELGNLIDPVLSEDYSGATVVKVGGSGQGADRAIGSATADRATATPFSRREMFTSGTNTDDTNTLNAEASSELAAQRVRRVLTGEIVETESLRFGVHFGFGDIISAAYAGRTFDCHLDTISGTVIGGVEKKLTIKFRGEEVL